MWGRIIEFMLACWLAVSPFIFGYPFDAIFLWTNDLVCSSLIAFFSLICFYRPLRKMHLCNLLVSFYLIGISVALKDTVPHESIQNYVTLGFLLLMIDLVPTDAEKPPQPWRDFYQSS